MTQLQLQVQQLQAQPAIISCGQARKQGHPSLKEMRAMGVTIAEAKCGGYESAEAGAAGYSATEMRASGYTVDEVNISLTALKLSGMTCVDAKAAGSVDGLKAAGYSLHEARVAGYSPTELRRAGYTCAEFKAADLTCHEAEAAGFSSREGADAGYCCCGSGGCYFHEWHSTFTRHCRKALQQSTDPAPAPAGGFLAPAAATPASVKDSIAEEGRVAFEKLFKSANSHETATTPSPSHRGRHCSCETGLVCLARALTITPHRSVRRPIAHTPLDLTRSPQAISGDTSPSNNTVNQMASVAKEAIKANTAVASIAIKANTAVATSFFREVASVTKVAIDANREIAWNTGGLVGGPILSPLTDGPARSPPDTF